MHDRSVRQPWLPSVPSSMGQPLKLENHRSNLSHWGIVSAGSCPLDTLSCTWYVSVCWSRQLALYLFCTCIFPLLSLDLAWVRPTSIYSGCWQTPRAPVAAGISLTHGCPQPNCLPWATHLTQGSRKRVGTAALETCRNWGMPILGRSRWLSIVRNWELICCPRGVSSSQCEVICGRAVQSSIFYLSRQKWKGDEVSLLILPLAK